MDKYEFSLKMEQMKKLIHEEDYATALKIVDNIDWNRVRNTNLLTMAATVYEKNDRLEEAKEILNKALDRAPVGKRLLYKLTELAVRTGSLDEAEDYYYEYRNVDKTDIGNYVLQYMILKARHAPYDRQLQTLELYCQRDPDEKWLYELATTYEYAGRTADCVKTCDRIALLYGGSQYGLKALRLKMRYADLTDEQKNILYPRSVPVDAQGAYGYDMGNADMGQGSYQGGYQTNPSPYNQGAEQGYYQEQQPVRQQTDRYAEYGLVEEPDISTVSALSQEPAEEYEELSADQETAIRNSNALAAARYENEDADFDAYVRNLEAKAAQQRAAEEAKRAEEARQAAIKAQNDQAEAARRAAVLKAQAEAQQAAMERQAEQNRLMQEAENAANAKAARETAQAAADSSSDEGQQMAFDFGDGIPKVVEEPEQPEIVADASVENAEALGGTQTIQTTETAGAASAVQAAAVNGAQLAGTAAAVGAQATAGTLVGAGIGTATAAADVYTSAQIGVPNTPTVNTSVAPVSTIDAVEAALNGAPAPINVTPQSQYANNYQQQYAPKTAAPQYTVQPQYNAQQYTAQPVSTAQYSQPQPQYAAAQPKAAAVNSQTMQAQPEQRPAKQVSSKRFNMIVEAESVEEGLDIAIDELKAIHEENGIQHASAKTTAEKLNAIGFTDNIISKIRGKDFVIEDAGDLDDDVLDGIYNFIRTDRSGTIVVLIDTPEGLDIIEDVCPKLFDVCDYVSDIDEEELEKAESKKAADSVKAEEEDEEGFDDEPYEDDDIDDLDDEADDDDIDDEQDEEYDDEEEDEYEPEKPSKKEPKKRSSGKVKEKFSNVKEVKPVKAGEQMEIDEFAQYCSQYATTIDCSITGKSMLALYERIELMEEDGIPLTKETAEQLIEEAADRAEKPPIGKRLSGMFHTKYDSNGCLILKEDDFIN